MIFPIAPERRPLDIDVHDDEEVRRWLARVVSEQVQSRREPVPAIHLLFDGHEEVLEWHRVREVDPGADLAATWRALAARAEPERRVLVLRLEHDDGTVEACMFEETWEDGAPTGWWFGHRPYVVEEGIGRLLDVAWRQHAGEGAAPEPFASILAPRPGARPATLLPAKTPEPSVWMQQDVVPDEVRLPTTAMEMTEQTQSIVLGQLEGEGLHHLLVFLIRGRAWEKWLLGDPLPAAGDDMVRWICKRAGQPDAVATAEGVLAQVDGKPERVIRIVAELGGQRAERAIVLRPKPGSPADVEPSRWMARELGPVGEGEGWLGVEPLLAGEMRMTPIGEGTPS